MMTDPTVMAEPGPLLTIGRVVPAWELAEAAPWWPAIRQWPGAPAPEAGLVSWSPFADNRRVKVARLSKPERELRSKFPRGEWLDLRSGDAEVDDPARADRWGPDRTIRADVITALLLGDYEPVAGHFPAVRIRGARITGRLDLMGATVSHALVCEGCQFEQELRFVEAVTRTVRITGSHLPSLNAARMRSDSLLNLYGSVIGGLLRLDRAHVAEVFLMGAQVGDGASAISADGLTVAGDMQCNDGFTASGRINMRGARIAGGLTFKGAVLADPGSAAHHRSALYLSRLQAGELDLRAAQPINGGIRLSNARIGALDDDYRVWPREIWLDGCTYDTINHRSGAVPVEERLAWLNRDTLGYRPQPYEELAAFYRRIGHDDDARRVLLAKQRHKRTTLHPARRVVGRVVDWTVGYGYRPWLAALWLAALLAAGTAFFTVHRPGLVPGGPRPPFNAFVYTLDLLVPISAFGLRGAFASTGTVQWVAYALTGAGWILASAVIAGVTRAIRRD